MKNILLLFTLIPSLVYSNIDSGGGESLVGQLVNRSSIGGYTQSTSSIAGNYTLHGGLINIIFIPYITSENIDSDNDGIPDNWELAHGLSISQDNCNLDSDGEGFTDLSEFISGTYPNDQNSFLDMFLSQENGVYKLSFNTIEDRTYTLEVSQDLDTYYLYYQTSGNGNSIDISFDPSDEANASIFGNSNLERIFFRLIVEHN